MTDFLFLTENGRMPKIFLYEIVDKENKWC